MSITLDIRIENTEWTDLPNCEVICSTAADATGLTGNVDVLLTDDAAMQALNKAWRDKDKPTDVLSFPAEIDDLEPAQAAPFLGDVAIGYGVFAKDAATQEKSLAAHLSHLIIHGILHLAGHDHIDATDAEEMEGLEISALAKLGYGNPYAYQTKS